VLSRTPFYFLTLSKHDGWVRGEYDTFMYLSLSRCPLIVKLHEVYFMDEYLRLVGCAYQVHGVIGGSEGERRLGGERVNERKEGTIAVSMRGCV